MADWYSKDCHFCKKTLDCRRDRYYHVTVFDNIGTYQDNPYVCEDCFEETAQHCNRCDGSWEESEYTKSIGSCPFCYKRCFVCGDIFRPNDDEDDTFYDENTGEVRYVCNDCGVTNVIYAYDTDVLDYLEFMGGGPRYLGVELELTISKERGRDLLTYTQGVRMLEEAIRGWALLKKDGSLPPYSVELVSAPATLEIHKERWQKLLPRIAEYFTGDNECCGMHVHVSRVLQPKYEMKLLSFMHSFDNASWLSLVAGRDLEDDWGREYFPQHGNIWPRRYYPIRQGKVRRAEVNETEHHSAVAIARDTLEFRIFQSTVDYQRLMANIELVSSLQDYIRTDCSVLNNRYTQFEKWLFSSRGFPNLKKRLLHQKHGLIKEGEKLLSAS